MVPQSILDMPNIILLHTHMWFRHNDAIHERDITLDHIERWTPCLLGLRLCILYDKFPVTNLLISGHRAHIVE